ncbi:MAG: serine hydrolase domain-containing protein [Candidatus Hodarchaeota archaeon]
MKCAVINILVILFLLVPLGTFHQATAFVNNNEIYTPEELFDEDFEEEILIKMEDAKIPSSAVSVIHNNKSVYMKGFGEQSDVDISYSLASISKTFVATAVLQLYDKGLINLDDSINDYLPYIVRHPDYPNQNITFKQLLSHTSGLVGAHATLGSLLLNKSLSFPDILYDVLNENGSYYSTDFFVTAPGTTYIYTNLGFDLLAYLVQLISNQSYEEYLNEYIFGPLSMTHSFVNVSNYPHDLIAIPYDFDESSGSYTTYDIQTKLSIGGGGVFSSVSDLTPYLIAHMNNGSVNGVSILNESTIQSMHDGHSDMGRHGFGWFYSLKMVSDPLIRTTGHDGRSEGARTYLFYSPAPRIGVIYLTNNGYHSTTNQNAWLGKNKLLYEFIFDTALMINQPKSETDPDATERAGFSIYLPIVALTIALIPIIRRRRRGKKN